MNKTLQLKTVLNWGGVKEGVDLARIEKASNKFVSTNMTLRLQIYLQNWDQNNGL